MPYKIILKITHDTTLREARPNTAPFFPKACLRKFVLAKKLFVPRPYFILYLTDKRCANLSWLTLQIMFSTECKLRLKQKI